jgi:hypothetical protein
VEARERPERYVSLVFDVRECVRLTLHLDVELKDSADSMSTQEGSTEERLPRVDRAQADGVALSRVHNDPNEAGAQQLPADSEGQEDQANDPLLTTAAPTADQAKNAECQADVAAVPTVEENKDALHYALVGLLAFIIGLMLVTLQGLGLYYSATGIHTKDITVTWCSPAFRDFVVAVTTGNCQKFKVISSSSNGIGCVSLPGSQQRDWLRGTIIALSTALLCEVADTVLMMCTTSETAWRKVKAQRPWFTMFFGVIMLTMLIVEGLGDASSLPKGLTEAVWVYRKEASRAVGRVCKGKLNAPGLRGMMIGYMDGLFQSWGGLYDGRS